MKTIRIDGEIGFEMTADEFQKRLNSLNLKPEEDLNITINSGGGSVFEGYAIYNKLKALPNKKVGKVEGLCASIATLILLGCDHVQMSEVSLFMVHKASTMAQGNSEELSKQVEVLSVIDKTLNSVYSAKTGKTEDEIETLLSQETYLDAKTALKEGWVDEIVDKVLDKSKTAAMLNQMAASIKFINPKNMGVIKDFFKNNFGVDAPQPETVENTEAVVEETTEVTNQEEEVVEETTETEEVKEISLEELNAKVDRLVEVVDAIVETMSEEAPMEEARIEEQVEANFQAMLSKLPQTKGIVPQSNGTLDKETDTIVPVNAKFMARMKELDKKTRR